MLLIRRQLRAISFFQSHQFFFHPSSASSHRVHRHFLLQLIVTRSISIQKIYASNLRIAALSREGKLEVARHIFDEMPIRDVVTWNAMITGYWQNGFIEESKQLFSEMPMRNVVSWNSMIAGCFDNERIDEACEFFKKMPKRNTASWNAMISGLVRFDRVEEAVKLFEEMPRRNVVSFTAMVDGYARKGEVERARALFDQIPEKNDVSWTVMINGYVENGRFFEAVGLFDAMPEKNVVTKTAMITGYFKEGKIEEARSLFAGIQKRDLILWNAMIAGYEQNGNGEEALKLFVEMLEVGMKPDHSTLVSVLAACSCLASLKEGRQIHVIFIKEGFESNISVCNALMTMYSKCGIVQDSELVFKELETSDLVSWNTVIAGCAQHGYYDKALNLFLEMCSNGLKPDGVTFLSVLSSCRHSGKVKESIKWFDSMVTDYGIVPRAEHYACMVDILSRAGQLEKVFQIIQGMPFEADAGIWGALLAACQEFSNVELGELAARKLLELQPWNSATYVMLSNIYAAAGMWKEVMKVRGLMKEKGVKKQPGYSWIEFGNKIHLFLGGDISHPQIDKIHLALGRIGLQMEATADNFVDVLLV